MDDASQPCVLVVDDSPDDLQRIHALLAPAYRTRLAASGERALALAAQAPQPDLVLLDVMMPVPDGYETCRRLKADASTLGIPVIFLTALSQEGDEQRGFDAGCVDYITKPVSPPILLARVRTHLRLKASADFLRDKGTFLEAEVQRRAHDIGRVQDAMIVAMTSLAETRDNDTGAHIRRTQHYVRALAMALRNHPRFSQQLDAESIERLYKSAPLHDIGKIGVPDRTLLKPGKLTPDERVVMQAHTTIGRDAIAAAEKLIGASDNFLRPAREIAFSHQEKWDGTGYPLGLAGEAIPVSARLMALADVYDTLISRRVYKPAFAHDTAVALIIEGRGTHFDPDVVDAFLSIEHEFRAIAARHADSGSATRAAAQLP